MNFLQLVVCAGGLVKDGIKQSAFIKSFLRPIVHKHCSSLGYHLDNASKKKVLFYYPMYTILACAEMYLALKGRGLNVNERKRLTLVAAMATLCDDLIDEHNWTRDEIFSLLSSNLQGAGFVNKAKLLLALNEELKSFWPLQEKYMQQLRIALEWQSISNRQADPSITIQEIVHICREKNGNTSLMFASLLDEEWNDAEKKFIYHSAIVGQFTNDAFDIYFDTRNGINTYINRSPSVSFAKHMFLEECSELHRQVLACDATGKNQNNCIRRMSCMHAFTLVAFDHLQQTEIKYAKPADWTKPARKEMVTDLALNRNRLKLLKYVMWLSEVR